MNKNTETNILDLSRKVRHEYHTLAGFKAGVMLEGWMVKSLRARKVAASGIPFVRSQNGEMFLYGLSMKPLLSANSFSEKSTEPAIKLLLNRKEIDKLIGAEQQQGQTVVLTRLYFEKHLVKADVALVKGKQNHDKRADIKARDDKRTMQRAVKMAR